MAISDNNYGLIYKKNRYKYIFIIYFYYIAIAKKNKLYPVKSGLITHHVI